MTSLAKTVRVSVVIAAYNAEHVVGAAITGALTQTHPDVEIVVVDDGSTDRTAAVASAYGDRVVLVQQSNAGPAAARNAGVRASTGELIAFCDADDVLLPPHLAWAMARLGGAQRTWVSSDAWQLDDDAIGPDRRVLYYRAPPPAGQLDAFLAINITSMFPMFPRAMFDEVDGMDEQMSHCEDWDLWLRSVLVGWRVVMQPRPSALYRRSPGSLSSNVDRMSAGHHEMLTKVLRDHGGRLTAEQTAAVRDRLDHPSALALVARGDLLLDSAEVDEAVEVYRLAVRLNPTDVRLRRKVRVLSMAPRSLVRPALRRRSRRRHDTT